MKKKFFVGDNITPFRPNLDNHSYSTLYNFTSLNNIHILELISFLGDKQEKAICKIIKLTDDRKFTKSDSRGYIDDSMQLLYDRKYVGDEIKVNLKNFRHWESFSKKYSVAKRILIMKSIIN
jgi:hypothetical protein